MSANKDKLEETVKKASKFIKERKELDKKTEGKLPS